MLKLSKCYNSFESLIFSLTYPQISNSGTNLGSRAEALRRTAKAVALYRLPATQPKWSAPCRVTIACALPKRQRDIGAHRQHAALISAHEGARPESLDMKNPASFRSATTSKHTPSFPSVGDRQDRRAGGLARFVAGHSLPGQLVDSRQHWLDMSRPTNVDMSQRGCL